jgi:hypothetical protein
MLDITSFQKLSTSTFNVIIPLFVFGLLVRAVVYFRYGNSCGVQFAG